MPSTLKTEKFLTKIDGFKLPNGNKREEQEGL
jgi:hypothetical protein